MRRIMVILAVSGALWAPIALPAEAQENGIVIQNNGIDSSDSAAGADNVQISRAPGNASSNTGPGVSNETASVAKDKNRDRKDRGERNNSEELAAPVEEPAAPAEGDYAAYADDTGWVDPEAAPQEAIAEPTDQSNLPIQLPNTGSGANDTLALAATVAALLSAGFGMALRGRRLA